MFYNMLNNFGGIIYYYYVCNALKNKNMINITNQYSEQYLSFESPLCESLGFVIEKNYT